LAVERDLDSFETLMKNSGLYTPDELREINETRMRARYRLGALLAKVERGAGPGRGKKMSRPETSFREYLKEIKLDKARAQEAQRIAAMPPKEFEKALVANHKAGVLNSVGGLVRVARIYWYRAARKAKHKKISAAAAAAQIDAPIGPFTLLYGDPPTQYEAFSEAGQYRAPENHYETLTDEEIQNFRIGGKLVRDIMHKDSVLFLWCTSSGIDRALKTMEAWGFEFKASAVWDKGVMGLGLVFRNFHEVLLYGTKKGGNMPGPQYLPPSVFHYPRGEHSAKPPEIRAEIEKMFPDFDATQRLELFANATEIPGWTVYGKPHATADVQETEPETPKPKKRSHSKKKPRVEPVAEPAAQDNAPELVPDAEAEAIEEHQQAAE
jgi:N6-adenosine-specific RNA methylase IME4